MKKAFVIAMVAWMTLLTFWTGALTLESVGHPLVKPAYAAGSGLDVNDLVTVRWQTAQDGTIQEVMPPAQVPLWKYVEGSDASTNARLSALELAMEADINAKDRSFHRTHTLIDGQR